ncbi:50S ribosomal protein L18 [archaeon CG10_big_fil_rev_8_21_14_0_10_43_11]|nr:MAG: 50S ribosomal protein L18 [archaeon CG10_big_fil_rev_8_21_14_0_10_43_11]
MAKNATYAVKFRRRIEGKTNYKRRLGLLKSGMPRLVVRITNTRVIVQFVAYEHAGDKVLLTTSSDMLKSHGWKGSTKNVPAAYLTGLLAGKQSPVKQAVLDSGISHPNQRMFAVLKGVLDTGVSVAHSPDTLPSDERISGAHLQESVAKQIARVRARIESGAAKRVKKEQPVKKAAKPAKKTAQKPAKK